uniref:Ankyrin repeat domain-containing protein SOWAHC-like n=1 Tax=Astatotilapia calliptera TaxID=8154 RepID=A0AAX7V0B3_ASTCA
MATSTDFQNEAAGISTFAGKTTNTMQPPQEPCPSMTEPPAENSRVHQSPDEAALCWSTDLGHLLEDDEQEEHDPDPPQDQPEVQEVKQGAAADDQEAGGQEQKEDRALPPDPDSNLMMGVANQDEAGESGGSVPSPVVTETEQRNTEMAARGRRPDGCFKPGTAVEEASLQKVGGPSDPPTFAAVSASRPTSSGDGGDVTCCDLLSLRSDSVSLASEFNVFGRSEEDDTRSVTTSSVMSLFHRVSLDPLEKEWLKSCAVGNVATQRRLLAQEPGLVLKKTALHWAARHGREDAVDMMLHSGADVNVRSVSGYTALHLASIHGHQDVVQTLINTQNAKTNIRDYHGKTAVQYWSGSADIFEKPESQSGGRCVRRQRTQRYALPSFLLSRSRSQGQLNLEFRTPPQSSSHDALDLHV